MGACGQAPGISKKCALRRKERAGGLTSGPGAATSAVTVTGNALFVVVPFPSSPLPLYPQHWARPPESTAHL